MTIQYTVAAYEEGKTTVDVKFFEEGVPEKYHQRQVNAVFDEQGVYDETATIERIEQVAAGVANKLSLGVITLVEDAPEPVQETTEPTQEEQTQPDPNPAP